ncbi:hypothetical protein GCM10012275_64850 [Longimycelium tulufanense]|uniref:Uncharacterized protein n=1 Tax=Longimycelium tulufanense TaxID=907463 RepID=A0A8J3CF67_9PSEU|nr:hypothetical protein GCM10012275_64850 [Longimycelium tulufanense]
MIEMANRVNARTRTSTGPGEGRSPRLGLSVAVVEATEVVVIVSPPFRPG